jgi:hypothetical protein
VGYYDVFIASLSDTGEPIWSKRFGDGDNDAQWLDDITVDPAGEIFISGHFENAIDFGGGPLVGAGADDFYVAKLSADGSHLWSQRFGDQDMQLDLQNAIDSEGNIVLVGYFQGVVDFGGGPLVSAGASDIVIAKLDGNGKHLWSKRFGGADGDGFGEFGVDAEGSILLTGPFKGLLDFGGGVSLESKLSYDVFLVKLSKYGVPLWAKQFGDASNGQVASGLAVDSTGSVVITGFFQGSLDFGDGKQLASAGKVNAFAAKFDNDGQAVWSKAWGGKDQSLVDGVSIGSMDRVLLWGESTDTIDFGGGPLTFPGGSPSYFIAELSADGQHLWSRSLVSSFAGPGSTLGLASLRPVSSSSILLTGNLEGTADFGGGPLVSGPDGSLFLAKLRLP